MNDCIFCKIIDKKIPSQVVFEDKEILAINDINPQAPTHVLILPKEHIGILNDVTEKNIEVIKQMFLAAIKVAKQTGISSDGYRTTINCNRHGGQEIFHLHLHLMGGKQLSGKMG
jgi:histidine triad (HIT) family protein